jgi:DNA adenine methylase
VKHSTARSPFPWFGGKQRLADDLIALFPPHDVYVEVFGGGGSVLFSKASTTLDVYNDLDDGLVTFFRMLRDRPEDLVPLLELTPYARAEWLECRQTWRRAEDEVERARRWFVVATQTFGGMIGRDPEREALRTGWRSEKSLGRGWGGERLGRMHLSRAASNANRVDHIWRFVDRMRRVQVEQLDWRDCLEKYDQPAAVFYLDPPYVPTTRRGGGYNHELTPEEHEELVERILSLEGVAIVSGYDHPIYAPLVERGGFVRHTFGVWCTAAQRSADAARDRRLEVIWASPRAAAPTLFSHCETA